MEVLRFPARWLVKPLEFEREALENERVSFWFFNYKLFILVLKSKMDPRWDNKEGKLKWWALSFFNSLFTVLLSYPSFIFNYKLLIEI